MLNSLLEQVKRAIFDDPHNNYPDQHQPGGLIDQISGLFGQHGGQSGTMQNPRPASEDPYGDPADQGYGGVPGNVRPASEDPYGDPADQFPQQNRGNYGYAAPARSQFPNVRPASEDPYGDPADR